MSRWLIAGTPTDVPYPCRCNPEGTCSPKYCSCSGRLDLENVGPRCCAHVNTPEVAARAQSFYAVHQRKGR